jgi:hypothetical protein
MLMRMFQYRKRYEHSCNRDAIELLKDVLESFNTASGMSIVATNPDVGSIFLYEASTVSIPQAV